MGGFRPVIIGLIDAALWFSPVLLAGYLGDKTRAAFFGGSSIIFNVWHPFARWLTVTLWDPNPKVPATINTLSVQWLAPQIDLTPVVACVVLTGLGYLLWGDTPEESRSKDRGAESTSATGSQAPNN